jgi:hypothetical protein
MKSSLTSDDPRESKAAGKVALGGQVENRAKQPSSVLLQVK